MPSAPPLPEIEAFIARWSGTAQAERANYARFLDELCPIIEVPKPDPATGAGGDYRYERGVAHREADGSISNRRIDLYKRGCFVRFVPSGLRVSSALMSHVIACQFVFRNIQPRPCRHEAGRGVVAPDGFSPNIGRTVWAVPRL
jgi:hypothetical protein